MPLILFPASAVGDGLSLLFGEVGVGVGETVKRKLSKQGFARKTCGFFSNEDALALPSSFIWKTRSSLFREAVFPPASGCSTVSHT